MIGPRTMSALLALALSMTSIAVAAQAQEKDAKPAEKSAEAPATPPPPPKEESSATEHSIKIAGQTIPYKATAATILLKNEKDEPTALVYFTAYTQ
jgi:carboxypeptidase C (cathepsin A)